MPPAAPRPDSHIPATVVIKDVSALWPLKNTASLDNVGKLNSGQEVSLKLTPYVAKKDTGLVITSHDVVMELVPTTSPSSAYITCRWQIELEQKTADGHFDQAMRFVCKGEAYEEDGESSLLSSFQKMRVEYSYTAFTPDGAEAYKDGGTMIGFSGSLNEYLEGDGTLAGGPTALNWDTYPVDQ